MFVSSFALRCLAGTAILASACGNQAPRTASNPAHERVVQLNNGNWWNGSKFVSQTMWVVGPYFRSSRPGQVDSVVDLSEGFVVPPFAEAHTHNIGCPPTTAESAQYIRDGIFYVMTQSNTYPPRSQSTASESPIDVTCAAAFLTPTGSHITQINEQSAARGNFLGLTKSDLDGKTHVIIDTRDDMEKKLPAILAPHPRFIKILIAFSEEWIKRRADSAFIGKRGLDPDLVPDIVRLAHRSGVQVSAHIETAADFRLALKSHVDIIAHMPGLRVGRAAGFPDTTIGRWILTDDDARLAAANRTLVITTVAAARPMLTPSTQPSWERDALRAIHTANFRKLRAHGVRLILGSDFYNGTSLIEAALLGRDRMLGAGIEPLGLLDNVALLNLWAVKTPQALFPGRRIGLLEEGYEASALVLSANPILDFANVRKITMRMKEGRFIHQAE